MRPDNRKSIRLPRKVIPGMSQPSFVHLRPSIGERVYIRNQPLAKGGIIRCCVYFNQFPRFDWNKINKTRRKFVLSSDRIVGQKLRRMTTLASRSYRRVTTHKKGLKVEDLIGGDQETRLCLSDNRVTKRVTILRIR